jgi:hypothetical protein
MAIWYMAGKITYEECHAYVKNAKVLSSYQALDVLKWESRISKAAIAGLFQAEGCVICLIYTHRLQIHANITQKSSPALLLCIQKLYQESRIIKDEDIKFKTSETIQLYKDIVPFLISPKKEQVELAMSLLNTWELRKGCRKRYLDGAKLICDEIKRYKHI